MINKELALIFFVLILASCQNRQVDKLFATAESLMETRPDSALALLQTIEQPQNKLSSSQYANYALLLTQAQDKNWIDISEDTLIMVATNYYANKGNSEKAALAYFYTGRVLKTQKNYGSAIKYFLLAKDNLSTSTTEAANLLGLIYYNLGSMYQAQFNYNKAIENYHLAQDTFEQAEKERSSVYININIGDVYLLMRSPLQLDSALYCYEKALAYAEQHKDSGKIAFILKNTGMVYQEKGETEKAKKCILKSIDIDKKNKFIFQNYGIISSLYLTSNQPDSTTFYINQLSHIFEKEDRSIIDKHSYYFSLYEIYKAKKDFQLALENYEKCYAYQDSILTANEQKSIQKIQEKEEKRKLENANHRLIIHRQYLLIVLGAILIVGILLSWIFSAKMKVKNKKIQEAQQTLEVLDGMLGDNERLNNKVAKLLVEKLEIAKKVAQMNFTPTSNSTQLINLYNKVFNKNLQESIDWENLYPIINDLHNNFVNKIDKLYPNLSEKEKQMCCLIRADFKSEEIGFILSYTYDSVYTKKSNLRQKLGFESMKNFVDFLKTL